jgi:CIC family chloride channel protein
VQDGSKTEQIWIAFRAFLRRHWQKALAIREKIPLSEETFHLLLAGGVGVIGGLVNVLFYASLDWVQKIIFHRHGDLAEMGESLPHWWQRFLIPTLGGLAAGLVLYWGLRFVGRLRSTNFLEVVVVGDGRLPFRAAVVRAVSSLLSIGTGGSIGREGAITQLTAMLASKWGQIMKWQPYRLRLLVACGAASGIAAPYNAPITGAVFAAQIVLGNFSMNLFAPIVFSSVIATMVSRNFFGVEPWMKVPRFEFGGPVLLPWFIVLGILAGGLGAIFLKMVKRTEELFEQTKAPLFSRLMLGGMLVGLIAIHFPQVWGNGYSVTNRILQDKFIFEMVLSLFCAKLLATLFTVGSGAVGGVFTPTLFLGAALGSVFGMALHEAHLATDLPPGAFALVGMGSMLAATTRSPLLAMIMIFEISLNYSFMPALMLATVISTLVARHLHPESIYTEPLRLKGLAADREAMRLGAATEQTVGDIMRSPIPPLRETATLREIADRFLTNPNNFLPVVDAGTRLIGLVALHDLKEYLHAGHEFDAIIAYDVMRPPPPCLTPNQRLLDALPTLLASEQKNVPVVTTFAEQRLVGSVVRAEALGMLSEAIASSSATVASPEPEAVKEAKQALPVPTAVK